MKKFFFLWKFNWKWNETISLKKCLAQFLKKNKFYSISKWLFKFINSSKSEGKNFKKFKFM